MKINGQRLSIAQQFTFDVGENPHRPGRFVRNLLLGPFTDTEDIDYGEPDA